MRQVVERQVWEHIWVSGAPIDERDVWAWYPDRGVVYGWWDAAESRFVVYEGGEECSWLPAPAAWMRSWSPKPPNGGEL